MDGIKGKIMVLKTNLTKDYCKPAHIRNKYGDVIKLTELKTQKQSEDIKNIKKLFRLKKENETMKDRIITNFGNFFEQEKDHCKPERLGVFYSNNYIAYEINGDRNKALSIKE